MRELKDLLKPKSIVTKILKNISWLFFDKILRMAFGVYVIALLSRYLGPEQFGLLNYSMSLVALFTALAALGLNEIVIRDLLTNINKSLTLGTAFVLRVIGSILGFVILMIVINLLRPGDSRSIYIVGILGVSLIFKSSDIIKFWYESQIKSKYVVIVENSLFITIGLVKIYLVFSNASLEAIAYSILIESVLVFFFLFYVYIKREKDIKLWSFQFNRAKELLKASWPLIISAAAWIIYSRIDQIMIGQMIDDTSVGYYSVATKLSEISSFIPAAIAFSIIPSIIKYRTSEREVYLEKFQLIYNVITLLLFLLAIMVTFMSNFIITTIFGDDYVFASDVLSIHFWTVILIGLATVSGRFLVIEGTHKVTMYRHVIGVVINIPLNFILIPIYGIKGAAIASMISLFCANYLFDFFNQHTKIVFYQKTKALTFSWLYLMVLDIINKFKR